ncbi:MAG: hemerythrin domain-containing protein [Dehalococcoidia bacterium]|nr:hemerythrin domain-containing protein [Dehalococcoidia bacterium]
MGPLPEPLAGLVRDHRFIEELVMQVRRALSAAGSKSAEPGLVTHALELVRDLSAYAEVDLALHIEKEEAVLFPAVRVAAEEDVEAMMVDMFAQHDEIRDRSEEIRETLRTIDTDHDELLEGVAKLNDGLRDAATAPSPAVLNGLYGTVRILDDLFQGHFMDEENHVFAPAVRWFDAEAMADLAEKMEALEAAYR